MPNNTKSKTVSTPENVDAQREIDLMHEYAERHGYRVEKYIDNPLAVDVDVHGFQLIKATTKLPFKIKGGNWVSTDGHAWAWSQDGAPYYIQCADGSILMEGGFYAMDDALQFIMHEVHIPSLGMAVRVVFLNKAKRQFEPEGQWLKVYENGHIQYA